MKIKFAFIFLLTFSLYGCDDLSDQVEVRIQPDFYQDYFTGEFRERSILVVTSLTNEPIQIQSISVNRGGCNSQISQGSQHLSRYGSYTKFLVPRCDTNTVKEVQLTLNNMEYIYSF